jgi:hypothetical protein
MQGDGLEVCCGAEEELIGCDLAQLGHVYPLLLCVSFGSGSAGGQLAITCRVFFLQ